MQMHRLHSTHIQSTKSTVVSQKLTGLTLSRQASEVPVGDQCQQGRAPGLRPDHLQIFICQHSVASDCTIRQCCHICRHKRRLRPWDCTPNVRTQALSRSRLQCLTATLGMCLERSPGSKGLMAILTLGHSILCKIRNKHCITLYHPFTMSLSAVSSKKCSIMSGKITFGTSE